MARRKKAAAPETQKKRTKKAPKKKGELEGVLAEVKKRYGDTSIRKGSKILQPDRISTGTFVIDFATLGGIGCSRSSHVVGERHAGKAQKLEAKVLTPDGWVMFKDVSVGDYVIGSGGQPTRVAGVYPRGVIESYKVSFTDKSELVVGKDHLWQVQSRKQAHTTGNHFVKTTDELFNSRLRDKNSGMCKYRIPTVSPVEFSSVEVPIEPYLLGVMLANGNLSNSIDVATNDVDIMAHANSALKGSGVIVAERTYAEGTRHWGVYDREKKVKNTTITSLRVMGLWGKLSRDKFIPEIYLRASIEDRISLLNGLMDCDGSTVYLDNVKNKGHAGARYHSYSRYLALGVQELVQSLGGTASIAQQYRKDDDVYEQVVSVVLPKGIPTFIACKKKVEAYEGRKRRGPIRSISHISPDDDCEMLCISVEAEDNLYVTEEYIVTHNSMLSNKIIANAQRQFPDKKVILLDTEGTFESVWAEKLGVDIDALEVAECETGEMALDIADAILQSIETSLVVVDSIAAMEPMKERESSAEDHLVAFHAKLIAEFVRKTTSIMIEERRRGHYVTLLNLNQFRSDIGGYGMNPRKIPGGRALGHATSFDIIMKNKENKGSDSNDMQTVTYNEHTYTITKNKMNNGPRTGEFVLVREYNEATGMMEGDVDDAKTVFSVAKKFGFVGGAGKNQWLEFLDYKTKFSLQDKAIQMLRDEHDLYWRLRTHIIRKQAEKLGMPTEFIRRIV